ncbi:uncharacterized protein [Periplaneta americana]|uniref:uncharacterized protein isoform X2 n=1 Tax=Periplaneta americana TaxID=6978 RepID=UPI0037E7F8E4
MKMNIVYPLIFVVLFVPFLVSEATTNCSETLQCGIVHCPLLSCTLAQGGVITSGLEFCSCCSVCVHYVGLNSACQTSPNGNQIQRCKEPLICSEGFCVESK